MSQVEDEYDMLVNEREGPVEEEEVVAVVADHVEEEVVDDDYDNLRDASTTREAKEEPIAAKQEKQQKITLASLERYNPPVKSANQSKIANNLRNTVHQQRAKTAPAKRADNTFLTGVPNSEQDELRKSTSQKKFLKPCTPLCFSAKLDKIVLGDVCPHRKQFTACKRFFCVAAKEKYEWVELLRSKSKAALEIVHEADKLWREKLEKSWEESIELLKAQQAEELVHMKKVLQKKTTNEKLIEENWKYMQYYELDKKDPLEATCPLPYTIEHVQFIERQTRMHREIRFAHRKLVLDQRIFEHQKEIEELKASISVPNRHLDTLRDTYLNSIDFQTKRAEKMLLYILKLAVSPRGLGQVMPPEKDDPIIVDRVKHGSTRAYQLLKTALAVFGQICGEIRRVYCNADVEVERFFAESRKFQKSERVKTPEQKSPKRSQSSGVYKSSTNQSSPARPTTAPTKLQSPSSANPEVRIIHDNSAIQEDDEEDDFQSIPKNQRSNSFAESVGEDIDDVRVEGSHQEEVVDEEIAAESAHDVSEVESEITRARRKSSSAIGTSYADSKADKSQVGYDSYTDDTDFDEQQQRDNNGKKKKKKTKKAKRKKIVKAFLDKNELTLAKMPDNKMQEKFFLETILASHAKPTAKASDWDSPDRKMTHSPSNVDAENSQMSEKRNPYPCCYCGKRFRGVGKLPPSIVNSDKAVRERAKSRASKERGLFTNFERKVELGDDYSQMRRTFTQQVEDSTKSQGNSNNRVFCSWVCVKRWTVQCCPMQMKYQNEMLIDIAAGYAVTI